MKQSHVKLVMCAITHEYRRSSSPRFSAQINISNTNLTATVWVKYLFRFMLTPENSRCTVIKHCQPTHPHYTQSHFHFELLYITANAWGKNSFFFKRRDIMSQAQRANTHYRPRQSNTRSFLIHSASEQKLHALAALWLQRSDTRPRVHIIRIKSQTRHI